MGNNVHVPVHTQAHNLFIFFAVLQTHDHLPVGWGGAGQGGVIIPNMSKNKKFPNHQPDMLCWLVTVYIYVNK